MAGDPFGGRSPQCKAHSTRSKKQCQRPSIRGGAVCWNHGGAARQVKRAATQRILDVIDPQRLIRRTAEIAMGDIRDLYEDDGSLKPIKRWPDWAAAAADKITTSKTNRDPKDGKQEDVVSVQNLDRLKAMDMLFRHLGLYKDRVEVAFTNEILGRLEAGRQRVAALAAERAASQAGVES